MIQEMIYVMFEYVLGYIVQQLIARLRRVRI